MMHTVSTTVIGDGNSRYCTHGMTCNQRVPRRRKHESVPMYTGREHRLNHVTCSWIFLCNYMISFLIDDYIRLNWDKIYKSLSRSGR